MAQTTAEQRAELRRLIDAQEVNAHYRSDHPEHAAIIAILNAGPALLADAEALAAADTALAAIFAEYDRLGAGAPRDYGDVGSLFDAVCSARANLRYEREMG